MRSAKKRIVTVYTMALHKEVCFETEICEHLAAHGWLYAEGDAAHYDRELTLFPGDVLAWVQQSQPKAWEALSKNHGGQAGDVLLARLREQLNSRGTLDVLRHGVEMIGLKSKLPLAQFKPALAMNPEILTRYAANRLRVVRQEVGRPGNRVGLAGSGRMLDQVLATCAAGEDLG